MTSIRGQAAPLPKFLTRCAHAYASGDTVLGEALFPQVVAEILPLVEYVIARRSDPTQLDPEALRQEALTRIWKVLKRGIAPEIRRVTYHTVVDAYKTSTGMGDTRGGRGREYPDEAAPATQRLDGATEPADAYHSDSVIDALDGELLLAELCTRSPMWALVAQYRIEGLSQNQIATNLETSRSEIRKTLDEIRGYLEQRAA